MGPFAELLHSLSQHGVSGQGGLGAEGLAALGAAVDPLGVILAPVVLDAAHAVAVSTGDGDWIIREIQTHRAVELLLCPQFSTHFYTHSEKSGKKQNRRRERSRDVKRSGCLVSQEENAVSQVRAGRGEQGGARATRQVERGKRVSVENC